MSEFMDDAKKMASEGAENKAEDYLGVQDQDAKDKNQ
jgi:hypothetical protein